MYISIYDIIVDYFQLKKGSFAKDKFLLREVSKFIWGKISRKNTQLLGFIVSFFSALIVGFIVLWLTDFIYGTEDPRFYQMVIPGLFGIAFVIALMNSKINS